MTVSALRTITIEAAPASIYGVCAVQPVLRWEMAEPDEVLDYALDVSALLADVGDQIASASAVVSPSGAGELIASALAVASGVIVLWLSGGLRSAATLYALKPSPTAPRYRAGSDAG